MRQTKIAMFLLDKVKIDIKLDIEVSDHLTRQDIENQMKEMIEKAERERRNR